VFGSTVYGAYPAATSIGDLVREAERFLGGDAETLVEQLAAQMERAAANTDYERAARLRDRIRALSSVRQFAKRQPGRAGGGGCVRRSPGSDAGASAVQAFFFRAGQNWGATVWYPKHDRDDTPEEVLTAFIAQFYDDKPVPKLILLKSRDRGMGFDDRSARDEGRAQGREFARHSAARSAASLNRRR